MANTAMLGSLMVPEMNRRGYAPYMSIGPIIGAGGLAMLIPPSAMGVLLGKSGAYRYWCFVNCRFAAGTVMLAAALLPGDLAAGETQPC